MAAILDSAAVKQPAERDLEVYRLVVVEGKSTRTAAESARISQTRVCQVVERVMQWLSIVLPSSAEKLPDESRLLLAQQIATSRLDHLYGEAMAAWQASKAEAAQGSQQGNVRYLAAAMQISAKLAKIPSSLLPLVALAQLPVHSQPAIPPVRDCSAPAIEQAVVDDAPEVDECGITVPTTHYEAAIAADQAAAERLMSIFDPVQADDSLAGGKPASTSLLVPAAPPLSRKQRRARQRMLEKKLRKAK